MKIPDKIYIQENDNSMRYGVNQTVVKGMVEYLRADFAKKELKETVEVAEEHAMLAGRMQMQEEMMQKAIDVRVYHLFGDEEKAFIPLYGKQFKQGEKVKVIIIKDVN